MGRTTPTRPRHPISPSRSRSIPQYNLNDEGRIAVNPDGTISVAWWLRDESGEWRPWMDNTFTKIEDEA
jgi:hypothetical protein